MNNTGIILNLAYPETIVTVADEWYSPLMRYVGIGKKNYVRAGHAALVLIDKEKSILEYHDFGRYIVPAPYGRVRGRITDHELAIPIKSRIDNNVIQNLDEILLFLATHPKITHGKGKMIASVCDEINYSKARHYINKMQQGDFVRYAAFIKNASNCSRFVTDTLIASVTNLKIRRKLIKSKWFTPSTIGNVVIANTQDKVYEVSEEGEIKDYNSSVWNDNKKYFLDKLNKFTPSFEGNLKPKYNSVVNGHAQWLSGIGVGAWFELLKTDQLIYYRFRRVSPYGNIDVEGIYKISDQSFIYEDTYEFTHYSNCHFFHVKQNDNIYRFDLIRKIN